MKKVVMVSGGFDPIHVGHVRMIQEAAEYGDVIVSRSMMYLTLAYDHRLIDGAYGTKFLSRIKELLESFSKDGI